MPSALERWWIRRHRRPGCHVRQVCDTHPRYGGRAWACQCGKVSPSLGLPGPRMARRKARAAHEAQVSALFQDA